MRTAHIAGTVIDDCPPEVGTEDGVRVELLLCGVATDGDALEITGEEDRCGACGEDSCGGVDIGAGAEVGVATGEKREQLTSLHGRGLRRRGGLTGAATGLNYNRECSSKRSVVGTLQLEYQW